MGMQIDTAPVGNGVEASKKLKITLPYDFTIAPQYSTKRSRGTILKRYLCTPMSIPVLLRIANMWKQHKCPPTDEWIKKTFYLSSIYLPTYLHIYITEYYSFIKNMKSFHL